MGSPNSGSRSEFRSILGVDVDGARRRRGSSPVDSSGEPDTRKPTWPAILRHDLQAELVGAHRLQTGVVAQAIEQITQLCGERIELVSRNPDDSLTAECVDRECYIHSQVSRPREMRGRALEFLDIQMCLAVA